MSFFQMLLSSSTLLLALCAGFGASIASGLIGPYVVVKRISSLSGSIAHSVLGGMGCALFFQRVFNLHWLHPIFGAIVAAVISAIVVGYIHLYYKEREDAVIAMVWSVGMALGVIFIYHTPGTNVDLTHFLIGNILWVTPIQLVLLLVLNLIILTAITVQYHKLLALCFDETQCELQNVPTKFLYLGLLVLISLTVVMLIYMMGVILALSMLVIPAGIASLMTRSFFKMMMLATLLNIVITFCGFWAAYELSWPVSSTIALLAGLLYLSALGSKKILSKI